MEVFDFIGTKLSDFLTYTGFANAELGNWIMILVGAFFLWLAIKKDFEPLLLIPIGLGIILGNIPFKAVGLEVGLYEDNSVLNSFLSGGEDRMVSAFGIPRYRCHDGFLGVDSQPEAFVGRCCRPIRYLRGLHDSLGLGFRA
mgnify:CR=1 FL=1